MKKTTPPKRPLLLATHMVRDLQTNELKLVNGGAVASGCNLNTNHNAKRLVVTP
jgi:hypothetical protein